MDSIHGGGMFSRQPLEIRGGIPRFTPDISYSTGNFSKLRERHATLQLDSVNGTKARLKTILARTNWPIEFFKGKSILECGCGAGPDTEVLLALGASVVAVDIAGIDVARKNLGGHPHLTLVQASILDLPFKTQFDIVFCHRVLQHTPNPEKALDHILRFVKPGGAAFVHSYSRDVFQLIRWKYALRPITKRMDPEKLYKLICWYGPVAYKLTNFLCRCKLGRVLTHVFIPFLNYKRRFPGKSDKWVYEFAIHDTFDALSPRYDKPIRANRMKEIATRYLDSPFEIVRRSGIILLRTQA